VCSRPHVARSARRRAAARGAAGGGGAWHGRGGGVGKRQQGKGRAGPQAAAAGSIQPPWLLPRPPTPRPPLAHLCQVSALITDRLDPELRYLLISVSLMQAMRFGRVYEVRRPGFYAGAGAARRGGGCVGSPRLPNRMRLPAHRSCPGRECVLKLAHPRPPHAPHAPAPQRWWAARRGFAAVGSAAIGMTQRAATWAGPGQPGLAAEFARWGAIWHYAVMQVGSRGCGLEARPPAPLSCAEMGSHNSAPALPARAPSS
jgi:hypothetical protein